MSQAAKSTDTAAAVTHQTERGRQAGKPFAGLIEAVLVEDPVNFAFPGSVARSHAAAAWTWVARDLCSDLLSAERAASGAMTTDELEAVMPDVLARMKDGMARAAADFDTGRRLRAMLGSDDAREALPVIQGALRSRGLLGKAQAFGRAVNAIADDAALGVAVQSMPLQDPPLASLLFHAALGQVANPTRLVNAVTKLSGAATEVAVTRHGFTPVIDAMLAHAQNQLHVLQPMGAFADIDLTCRGLDRFHRLVRAITGYVELTRGSRWATVVSAITKQVSDRVEPRLRNVVSDLNLAMRRGREGADRLDNDALLSAINGIYLLATVRECRDSLALNALFDQAWSQSGQALELHLQRNLDLIRQHPGDPIIGTRLDAGIKMAEVRFNPEYADTLRRARAAAERRS